MRWAPHAYQLHAVKWMVSRACAGLLLDPGLGKTAITMAAFDTLRQKKIAKKMLVIAPLRPCHRVWPVEAQKWGDFRHLRVEVLHGPDKEARLQRALAGKSDVDVINYEGLPWLFAQRLRRSPREPWPWDVLVCDESTRLKHPNTQRFKTLRPYLPEFSRRYILTGSPVPNGLMDLFGQVYVLDLGNALGRYITHYRSAFFDSTGFGGYTWTIRPGMEKVIYDKLQPMALRMAAEDYLTLPPLIHNRVEVELPPEARRAYDTMEQDMLAALEDGNILAANAAAATNKCRQIANGGIYHEGGEKWTHLHEAKVDAVEDLIEELSGKPALVAYEYKHDLERLQKRLGKDTPWIGGGIPASRFRVLEQAWNDGKLPVLLAQPQSVAHGLNLQGTAAAVINMAQTWDLEVREQFIRRVWRQGQKERVIVHDVVAKDTVDEVILKMLGKKDHTQRSLLAALQSYRRAR